MRRILDEFDRQATPRFVALTIGLAAIFWFVVSRADYANFHLICNHDPGAALRTDEIVASGSQPGTDFFYYYGPLPILLCRVFFFVFGRSPLALLALIGILTAVFFAGLTSIVMAFAPTRLGVLLIAVIMSQVVPPNTPTHAFEAAILIWAVAMRIRGQSAAAMALASSAILVKVSMGTVMTAELAALIALDALRTRSRRPLMALAATPITLGIGLAASGAAFSVRCLRAILDPAAGAAIYKAVDYGFFREGRYFWHPAGHTIGWYLGGLAGPWVAATVFVSILALRGALRLVRRAFGGESRDRESLADEISAIAGFANLAFILGFFAPNYYTWVPLAGVIPWMVRARFGSRGAWTLAPLAWAATALCLLCSATGPLRAFAQFLREPRVHIGDVSMPADEADEWKEAMALAHSVGSGTVTVAARAANFGVIDPTLKQGHYWMMLRGMRKTPSVDELLGLAHSSDTVFVTRHDYETMAGIPDFHLLMTESTRIHDGKYFVLLRPLHTAGQLRSM
jgi:hypothetical protein